MPVSDGTDRFRKQAPKLVGGEHPDWFWLVSGGIDSVAAFLLTKDALHENYGKRPVMVYLDTRVGLPVNRLYVEQLADAYGEQLWTLRTHEKFEDRIAKRGKYADRDDAGPPGAALHSDVQNELKGRQRETLANRVEPTIYVTGIRSGESEERASHPKGEVSRGIRYVKPVYELTKRECAEIILRHPECPIHPGWWWNHYTDCGCGSNGDPSENDTVEKRYPAFGRRIREYEEAIPNDGVKSMLGWDGLTAEEKRARNQGQRQLSLCGDGCQRRVPMPIERAFKVRCYGATVEEAVGVLYEETDLWKDYPVEQDLIPATDGESSALLTRMLNSQEVSRRD